MDELKLVIEKKAQLVQTRAKITKLGTKDIAIVDTAIGGLCKIWDQVHYQAQQIEHYMARGEDAFKSVSVSEAISAFDRHQFDHSVGHNRHDNNSYPFQQVCQHL